MEDLRVTVKGWCRVEGEMYCGSILEFLDRITLVILDDIRQELKVVLIDKVTVIKDDKDYKEKIEIIKKELNK